MNLQWILLISATVLLLPPALALLAGRAPRRLRPRLEPVRARGWCLLGCWLTAPLNAVPRATGASFGAVMVGTVAGGACMLAGIVVLFIAERRVDRARQAGPRANPAAR